METRFCHLPFGNETVVQVLKTGKFHFSEHFNMTNNMSSHNLWIQLLSQELLLCRLPNHQEKKLLDYFSLKMLMLTNAKHKRNVSKN